MTRLYSEDAEYISALEQERDAWASRHASLERELAELRGAASRLLGWLDNETIDGLPAHESDYFSLDTRVSVIAMRALLPAAREPVKEPPPFEVEVMGGPTDHTCHVPGCGIPFEHEHHKDGAP